MKRNPKMMPLLLAAGTGVGLFLAYRMVKRNEGKKAALARARQQLAERIAVREQIPTARMLTAPPSQLPITSVQEALASRFRRPV